MTVVRVLSVVERLDAAAWTRLADRLTNDVLEVEVGVDNPIGRRGVMVLFEEMSRDRWAVGGRFDDEFTAPEGRLVVTIHAMEGVWTGARRAALIDRCSASLRDVLRLEPPALGSTWILFSEIPEGSWGAFGAAISIGALLEPAGFTPDRCEDARRVLSAGRSP